MPRAPKKVAEEAPKDISPEVPADVIPDEAEPQVKPKKAKKTSFDVYSKDNTFVRTYSVEQHGKDAGDLAEEYAKKLGGSVK